MPRVTVIALCYNHAAFVEEALMSILNQKEVIPEVIVVDDASSDDSKSIIQSFLAKHNVEWKFIDHKENLGNCKSFNEALLLATGDYIIDFATDDVLFDNRLFEQITFFDQQNDNVGLIHSNANYINNIGRQLGTHSSIVLKGKPVPQGDVFTDVLSRYFICPPTMMFRRRCALEIGGYDNSLAYEDFDFLLRFSRKWHILYQNKPLTYYRKHDASLGQAFNKNPMLHLSTAISCQKIYPFLTTKAEKKAFNRRVKYQIREAWRDNAFRAVIRLTGLLEEINALPFHYRILKNLAYQRNKFLS